MMRLAALALMLALFAPSVARADLPALPPPPPPPPPPPGVVGAPVVAGAATAAALALAGVWLARSRRTPARG